MNKISEPQLELYTLLKKRFPDATLELPIGGRKNKIGHRIRWADIGIPSLKIDFEYDGYPHDEQLQKWRDTDRDEILLSQGWLTIRVDKELLSFIRKVGQISNQDFLVKIKALIDYKEKQKSEFNQFMIHLEKT